MEESRYLKIPVAIECKTGESDVDYEALEIERPENELEWREGYLFISDIISFYRDHSGMHTLIQMYGGDLIMVKEDLLTVNEMIDNAIKEQAP